MHEHVAYRDTTNVVCLSCARRRKSRLRQVAVVAVSVLATVYAGYCVYRERVITFTDIAVAAGNAHSWIVRRDLHEKWLQDELAKARLERDEARQDGKKLFLQLKRLEKAMQQHCPTPQRSPFHKS